MWNQLPQQQHQALEDAKVEIQTSSMEGTAQVIVRDSGVTSASINAAYLNAPQTAAGREGVQRTKLAIASAARRGGSTGNRGALLFQYGNNAPALKGLTVDDDIENPTFTVT